MDYEVLCSKENLDLAFRKARKGKTLKNYVIEFENNLKENLHLLRTELLMQTYTPRPLTTFILRDPKTRKISKSDFRDRVIHHAICNVIEPSFEKKFIHDSFANRIGKGGLNAIKRFDVYKRKVSKNNNVKCFVLKADVKHYFPSVNHEVLLRLLENEIKDREVVSLIKIILKNHESKTENKGMPLGNLTSQLFANIYLNELDQFVKHELKAKHFIRYVDDFVILHRNKEVLKKYESRINQFLKEKLQLELHREKTKIILLNQGISFLGFKIFYHHKTLQRKNKNKFKNKLIKTKKEYNKGKIDREKIIEVFEGHLAYASNANTYKYRKRITKNFNKNFSTSKETSIQSVKKHENFNQKIENAKFEFSTQKTHQLLRKGLKIEHIAKQRQLKIGTVWQHVSTLIEHHQIRLKEVLPNWKTNKIFKAIRSPEDKLKEIKQRLEDNSISYDEINCVLANIKGKLKNKSATYYIQWYQRTNCHRKCYYNKQQRESCRVKFQKLQTNIARIEFTKKEFLEFVNTQTTICELPFNKKNKFLSWQEFKKKRYKKRKKRVVCI